MRGLLHGVLIVILNISPTLSLAQFAEEDAGETGVTNPLDFSWRAYKEALNRFPKRTGVICYNAYILDKTGSHTEETLRFLEACADHGNVASMIYIASLYENGNRIPINYEVSAKWLKRAAKTYDEAGYSNLAAYHFGVALYNGRGVEKNIKEACRYLRVAMEGGIAEANDFFYD